MAEIRNWVIRILGSLWCRGAAPARRGNSTSGQCKPLLWGRNEAGEHIPLLPEPVAPPAAEIAHTPAPANLHRKRLFLFAARLRSVAKLNHRKDRNRPSLKAGRKTLKRAPQLFPVKRKAVVAKRPTTKIIVTPPKRPSAVIIALPTGAQRAALVKARRAA